MVAVVRGEEVMEEEAMVAGLLAVEAAAWVVVGSRCTP